MFEKRWYTFKPISYVGMALMFFGIFGDGFLNTNSFSIGVISMLMLIIGLALMIKGRREHGL